MGSLIRRVFTVDEIFIPSYFFPDFLIPAEVNGPFPLAFSAISFLAWASVFQEQLETIRNEGIKQRFLTSPLFLFEGKIFLVQFPLVLLWRLQGLDFTPCILVSLYSRREETDNLAFSALTAHIEQ